jgi:hypothetical protein
VVLTQRILVGKHHAEIMWALLKFNVEAFF